MMTADAGHNRGEAVICAGGYSPDSPLGQLVVDELAPVGHNVVMQTVVETRHYVSRAEKLLSENEQDELIGFLATHALRGDVLEGTGGIRKVRFARRGRGKSGGVRVIYYYYSAERPIYLLDIFGKNEKANLTRAERNALAKVATEIKQQLRRTKI